MKAYDKPNIEILSTAIGDLDFCSSFISTKLMEVRVLLSQLEQVGMMDPQVALIPYVMMTSIGLSDSAWLSTPPTLPGNKLSSA
ncbi:hypothetical protein EMCRGX_G028869 [Ephydatia muelleri]